MNSKAAISADIFAWKMSGKPVMPIGKQRYEYLPQGNIRVQILDESGSNLMV